MARQIFVVLSNAVEGKDDEFNEWYTNTHLGDIIKLDGYVGAQRYKVSDTQLGSGELPYRYLAIYEVEVDDPDAAAKVMGGATTSGMYISPALDLGRTVAWFYTPITPMVTAE